jgi:hypothetical protein
MIIWNDSVQYQILMDALNFSNNSLVGLPREFNNCGKTETVVTTPAANCTTNATGIPKQDLTNFLFAIPFAANSTRREGVTRTENDVTWITNGIGLLTPFHAANGAATTCLIYLLFKRYCALKRL